MNRAGRQEGWAIKHFGSKDPQETSVFAHGAQSATRTMEAMPVEIFYAARLERVVCEKRGYECLFYPVTPHAVMRAGDTIVIPDPIRLDAFGLRDAFLNVKTETDALEFLSQVGAFWPMSDVTWKLFQEWQQLARYAQDKDFAELALRDNRARQGMLAVRGFPNSFFTAPDFPESESEKSFRLRLVNSEEYDAAIAQVEVWRKTKLRELAMWFYRPPGSALSIEWEPSGQAIGLLRRSPAYVAKVSWSPEYYKKELSLKPILIIKAACALEAIAAAIYADRCQGWQYVKCEACEKLFKKESEHGQKYCSPGCRNMSSQREWRNRQRKQRDAAKLPTEKQKKPSGLAAKSRPDTKRKGTK